MSFILKMIDFFSNQLMYFILLSIDHYLERFDLHLLKDLIDHLKHFQITSKIIIDNLINSIMVSDLIRESCYSSFDLSSIYKVISNLNTMHPLM